MSVKCWTIIAIIAVDHERHRPFRGACGGGFGGRCATTNLVGIEVEREIVDGKPADIVGIGVEDRGSLEIRATHEQLRACEPEIIALGQVRGCSYKFVA